LFLVLFSAWVQSALLSTWIWERSQSRITSKSDVVVVEA
jgi:hypothetical protein